MDDRKPSIPPCQSALQSASERTRTASSVAVYYRNEEEVRRGFLIALSAMGLAQTEQLPEPAKPPVRGAKP
jgi:hypothetical protein